jgi:hypothetical protein
VVQELGENCSASVHSSFSHPGLLVQAGPFRTYLTSNRQKPKSHLIPFLPVHWGDSRSRLPDSTASKTTRYYQAELFRKEKRWQPERKTGIQLSGNRNVNPFCQIEYVSSDSDVGMPCGKPALWSLRVICRLGIWKKKDQQRHLVYSSLGYRTIAPALPLV